MNRFEAFNFSDFRDKFLVEKNLDSSPDIKMGELSKILSKTNIDVADKLNNWAAKIVGQVTKQINRLNKRPNTFKSSIRSIPAGDKKSDAASIIVLKIESIGEIEASIFDNNKIAVSMPLPVANIINRGNPRKFLSSKDKVSDYLIGILEKVVYQ